MKFFESTVGQAEANAVSKAVLDGDLATGRYVKLFELEFLKLGYANPVAVNSGTTALWLALAAVGVGPGDEVIVTPYTISATVNPILQLGATPVFVDVEPKSYNMDPTKIANAITEKTKAILPASIFGVPCKMAEIKAVANGIPVIEDSIEALGAFRSGLPVGSDADICTFGFYPNKQVTTAQGGLVSTSNGEWAAKMLRMRQHGFTGGPSLWTPALGYNLRLPDPLAAMGIVQLGRLEDSQLKLAKLAQRYDNVLCLHHSAEEWHDIRSWFVYVVELPAGSDKKTVAAALEDKGIPTRPYFVGLSTADYLQTIARGLDCPVSTWLGHKTLALPFYPALTEADQLSLAAVMEDIL
jgi:perosamine synthetase